MNFSRTRIRVVATIRRLNDVARQPLVFISMLLFVVVLSSIRGYSQLTTADINGTVYDSSGAVLPNANVTLTNTKTRDIRHTHSNDAGEYSFTFLLPGTYSIKVEAQGFTAFTSTVEISAGNPGKS